MRPALLLLLAGCSAAPAVRRSGPPGAGEDDADGGSDASASTDGPCETRIRYGSAWIHDASAHPDLEDRAPGLVTWDGLCTPDAWGNSYATLSNGWTPYFEGPSACLLALDPTAACEGAPVACETLVSYGPSWVAPADHPTRSDRLAGRLFPVSDCAPDGPLQHRLLSNGWDPHFDGDCALSFRHLGCGGLYENPVIPLDCPDPGVAWDGTRYWLACTGFGTDGGAFPLWSSSDLVTWTSAGSLLPSVPTWAVGDLWAPEIHRVGGAWRAVFTARAASGQLAVGLATAPAAGGPWTDSGAPLLQDGAMGLIDPSLFANEDGSAWLLWKEDGNALGLPTPILVAPLAADGRSLAGAATELLRNDRDWEGAVVEGPWLIAHDGLFYLFYSGNAYASAAYALGVARAASPLGPFEKAEDPVLSSAGAWEGPGHASVIAGPNGDLALVYHAWTAGHAGQAPGRLVLVDTLQWQDGWPVAGGAPSSDSRPLP